MLRLLHSFAIVNPGLRLSYSRDKLSVFCSVPGRGLAAGLAAVLGRPTVASMQEFSARLCPDTGQEVEHETGLTIAGLAPRPALGWAARYGRATGDRVWMFVNQRPVNWGAGSGSGGSCSAGRPGWRLPATPPWC